MRKPVRPRAATAAGMTGLTTVPRRRDHFDGTEVALVVGGRAAHQMTHARVDGGLGERERRVDGALDLGRRAGEIRDEAVSRHGDGHGDGDGVGVDAVVVHPVGEGVAAVGHGGDGIAGEALGLVEERRGTCGEAVGPVLVGQGEIAALAGEAGRHLRAHVAEDLARHAHVAVDQLEHRLHRLARRVEPEGRDAQAFLEDLRGVAAVASRRLAPHVELMPDARRPAHEPRLHEDGLEDVEVGQVRSALEGVVEDEHVAGGEARPELAAHVGHGVGDGAQVQGQGEALGDEAPLHVAQGAGHVHGVLEIVRVGRAHERDGHLVHDGVEAVLHQLEENGIAEIAGAHRAPPVVMTMLP